MMITNCKIINPLLITLFVLAITLPSNQANTTSISVVVKNKEPDKQNLSRRDGFNLDKFKFQIKLLKSGDNSSNEVEELDVESVEFLVSDLFKTISLPFEPFNFTLD